MSLCPSQTNRAQKLNDTFAFEGSGACGDSTWHAISALDSASQPIPGSGDVAAFEYELFFLATMPQLSLSTYFISAGNSTNSARGREEQLFETRKSTTAVRNAVVELTFGSNGLLRSISNVSHSAISHSTIRVNQSLVQYLSSSMSEQNSGAYVFRPEQSNAVLLGGNGNGGSGPFDYTASAENETWSAQVMTA